MKLLNSSNTIPRLRNHVEETVATKLQAFKNHLKTTCNLDFPIYISPAAANMTCKAMPSGIMFIRVNSSPLLENIVFFCRAYGLKYELHNVIVTIDIDENVKQSWIDFLHSENQTYGPLNDAQ